MIYDESIIGKKVGGKRDKNGKWVDSYMYTRTDIEFLNSENKEPKDENGVPITLDSIRIKLAQIIKDAENLRKGKTVGQYDDVDDILRDIENKVEMEVEELTV